MTEADLLRRVCLDPADDLPRLLYADWCDETGQVERAEFIRVQIEKVRVYRDRPRGIFSPYVDTHSWKTRFEDLRARERDLFRLGDVRGDYPLPHHGSHMDGYHHVLYDPTATEIRPVAGGGQPDPPTRFRFVYRRGWINEACMSCADWLTHGPAIVQQQPITRVTLIGTEPFPPADVQSKRALLWARQEAGLEVTV